MSRSARRLAAGTAPAALTLFGLATSGLIASGAAMFGFAATAAAQEPAEEPGRAVEDAQSVAETPTRRDAPPAADRITVTAQKREQDVIDVPVSLSVFDDTFFERGGIEGLDDLSLYTPNVVTSWDFNPQFTTVSIRGLTSNTSNAGIDPSVGIFLDGIYLGRPEMYSTELADIERVEVLRGPQGALYGKNTTVGAINIVTRRPTAEFAAEAKATFGNYDQRRVGGWVSGPVSESVRALVSGFWHERDGFTVNTLNGEDLGRTDTAGMRAKIEWLPTDKFDVLVTGDWYRDDSGGSTGDWFILSPLVPFLGGETVPENYRTTKNDVELTEREIFGVSAEARYRGDGYEIVSLTGWRTLDFDLIFDFDTTPARFITSGKTEEQSQFSQEFRIASTGAGRFNYVAGVYAYIADLDQTSLTVIGPDLVPPPSPLERERPFKQRTESYAAFGQISYDVTDALTASLGLRLTVEDREVATSQTADDLPTIPRTILDRNEVDLSPSASLTYSLTPDVSLFGSYSQGFKSGGFNAATVELPQTDFSETEFEEERGRSFEIGTKGRYLDGALAVNLALFWTEIEDLQVSDFDGDQIVVRNAAEARARGVELDVTWAVTENFDLAGALGYTDSEYLSYPDAPGVPPSPPNPPSRDISGQPLSRAPEWNASVIGTYYFSVPGTPVDGYLRADYTWLDDHFLGAEIDPVSLQESYGLVNARLAFLYDDRWEIGAYVRNATEEYYLTALGAPFGDTGRIGWPGAPRTWGGDITFRY